MTAMARFCTAIGVLAALGICFYYYYNINLSNNLSVSPPPSSTTTECNEQYTLQTVFGDTVTRFSHRNNAGDCSKRVISPMIDDSIVSLEHSTKHVENQLEKNQQQEQQPYYERFQIIPGKASKRESDEGSSLVANNHYTFRVMVHCSCDNVFNYGGGLEHKRLKPKVVYSIRTGNTEFFSPSFYFPDIQYWFYIVLPSAAATGFEHTFGRFSPELGLTFQLNVLKPDVCDIHFVSTSHLLDVYYSNGMVLDQAHSLRLFWGLSGPPKPPPLFAIGFHASRWGWKDRKYISDVLDQFDAIGCPLDAFIMDFEWYTNFTGGDYLFPTGGVLEYPDFRFGNKKTFPDVANQKQEYLERNLQFGAIRKPRLGDFDLLKQCKAEKMLLKNGNSRNLDYSKETTRSFYSNKLMGGFSSSAGESFPNFWWNDEGETLYFTYHYWILSEIQAAATTTTAGSNNKRKLSINRSFTPGMQRLQAVSIWTGDIESSWKTLQNSLDQMVRWFEAGISLPSMDIGGFQGGLNTQNETIVGGELGELISRWYELGAFTGIMRIHSTLDAKPHFPFKEIWGEPYSKRMIAAVRLRYSLIPAIYSSLHHSYKFGKGGLVSRASSCHPNCFYFFGERMLIIPVLTSSSSAVAVASTQSLLLPSAPRYWYNLKSGKVVGTTRLLKKKPTDPTKQEELTILLKSGSINMFHAGGAIPEMRASELVGSRSRLKVIITSGDGDCSTYLYEDDGVSIDSPWQRWVKFHWEESTRTVSWETTLLGEAATSSNLKWWYLYVDFTLIEYTDYKLDLGSVNLEEKPSGSIAVIPNSI